MLFKLPFAGCLTPCVRESLVAEAKEFRLVGTWQGDNLIVRGAKTDAEAFVKSMDEMEDEPTLTREIKIKPATPRKVRQQMERLAETYCLEYWWEGWSLLVKGPEAVVEGFTVEFCKD